MTDNQTQADKLIELNLSIGEIKGRTQAAKLLATHTKACQHQDPNCASCRILLNAIVLILCDDCVKYPGETCPLHAKNYAELG